MAKKSPHTDYIRERTMQGIGVTEIHRELVRKFPENPPAYVTVKKWASYYKAAREGREDDLGMFEVSKISKKFREFIKSNMDMGRTPRAIYDRLKKRYPKSSPCCATVVKWCNRIQYAREGQQYQQQLNSQLENSTGDDSRSLPSSSSWSSSSSNMNNLETKPDDFDKMSDSYLYMTPNFGFHQRLEPEQIYNSFIVDGERFYAIKWKNWITRDLVLAKTAIQQCPELVKKYEDFVANRVR